MDVFLPTRVASRIKAASCFAAAACLAGCLGGGGGGGGGGGSVEQTDPLVAETRLGDFRGVSENAMRVFRGIRYGNAQRFAAPTMAQEHEGVIELGDFADACAQPDTTFGNPSASEDCLYLNVYAPAEPGEYPVIIWIHGGALLGGDGGPDWEPERLVERGVAVVTINYRLGTLGFLPHTELGDSNFGFQDQQLAMRWVQENISAFGGDPDNVTIFGESAGGHSVLSHIVSPAAAGLFHRAIVHSGSYNGNQMPLKLASEPLNEPDAEPAYDGETRFGQPIAERVREKRPDVCGDDVSLLECLRAVDLDTLFDAQTEILSERRIEGFVPVFDPDSTTLPWSINQGLASGDFNKVPVLMGSNLDEGDLFMLISAGSGWTGGLPASYYAVVANLIKENSQLDSEAIADQYLQRARALIAADPIRQAELQERPLGVQFVYDYTYAYSLIVTDWRFNCPNDAQWSQLQEEVDTYGYWFSDRGADAIYRAIRLEAGVAIPDVFPLGASHAFELPYLLNSQEKFDLGAPSPGQQALSDQMLDYWATFAAYGDPNSTEGGAEAIEWPRYTEDGNILRLDAPVIDAVPVSDFRTQHNCAFWAEPPQR